MDLPLVDDRSGDAVGQKPIVQALRTAGKAGRSQKNERRRGQDRQENPEQAKRQREDSDSEKNPPY